MANYCFYEVRVKGSKQSVQLVYNSMPVFEHIEITDHKSAAGKYEMTFEGNCKWSVNWQTDDSWNQGKKDFPPMNKDEMMSVAEEYIYVSLRAKSEIFDCDILVHYWSPESEFDQFDHYKKGKCIKKRKIWYDPKNQFDWSAEEFKGHAGEYDESVNGEANDVDFMSMLGKAFDFATSGHTCQIPEFKFGNGPVRSEKGYKINLPEGFTATDNYRNGDSIYEWGAEYKDGEELLIKITKSKDTAHNVQDISPMGPGASVFVTALLLTELDDMCTKEHFAIEKFGGILVNVLGTNTFTIIFCTSAVVVSIYIEVSLEFSFDQADYIVRQLLNGFSLTTKQPQMPDITEKTVVDDKISEYMNIHYLIYNHVLIISKINELRSLADIVGLNDDINKEAEKNVHLMEDFLQEAVNVTKKLCVKNVISEKCRGFIARLCSIFRDCTLLPDRSSLISKKSKKLGGDWIKFINGLGLDEQQLYDDFEYGIDLEDLEDIEELTSEEIANMSEEEITEKLTKSLDGLHDDILSMASELGEIGDTGYSMYEWTFNEGNRQQGDGWSIAIPDGFSVIPSFTGRCFEAVSKGYENEEIQLVHILPGEIARNVGPFNSQQDLKNHIEQMKRTVANGYAMQFGVTPKTYTIKVANGMGCLCVCPTEGNTYSFQTMLFVGNNGYNLRVQTGLITESSKEELKESVIRWLDTFEVGSTTHCKTRASTSKSSTSIIKDKVPASTNNATRDELDSEILKFLSDGIRHTAEEMQARIKILRNVTMQRVFGALRRLTNNNSVVQITKNGKKFYCSTEALYNNAVESFKKSKTAKQFEELIETFTLLIKYKDSEEYIAKCRERILEIKYAEHSKIFNNKVKDTLKNWEKALAGFEALGDFLDSVQKAEECRKNIGRLNAAIKEQENKLDELKKEHKRLYPYAGQTEELEKKKAQAEAHRRVVVSKLETKSKEKQSLLKGFISFLVLSVVMLFATAMADFSFMSLVFDLVLIILTIVAFCAYNDSRKQTAALKAEYDTACEIITQLEKQLAEAKKSPTFEKFCTDKGIDESENIAEKINNLKG